MRRPERRAMPSDRGAGRSLQLREGCLPTSDAADGAQIRAPEDAAKMNYWVRRTSTSRSAVSALCSARAGGARLAAVRQDKALRPDTFRAPSRASGVRVESEAYLDVAEHDGIWPTASAHAKTHVRLCVDKAVAAPFCGHPRTFAGKRKCATEEMSVVCKTPLQKPHKNSVICRCPTIEWE
jgi:hypothetical protein